MYWYIILHSRTRVTSSNSCLLLNVEGGGSSEDGDVSELSILEQHYAEQLDVSCLLQEELRKENLSLLSGKNLIDALSEFVDHQENDALSE